MSAFHWLDIATELFVELIDEHQRSIELAPASGDPFVPASDHDEGRLQFEGSEPLFLEIVTVVYSVWSGVLDPVMETAPARVAGTHIGDLTVLLPQVLSGG